MVSETSDIWSPLDVGGVELRNRVVVPGHTTNFGRGNRPTERHVAYHAARAAGGVGLIITEAVRVHPTSAGRSISLGSFDDDSIPAYAAIADAVHAEGSRLFAQLMHAGRQANGDATRTAAWSASPVPWAAGAATPHAMGRGDIDVLVRSFGDAARRFVSAGYDGLELHLGHGHLLQQFLSPATNARTDDYGGDLDRRLRLTREVLAAVRAAAPDMPIGLRVSADEFLEGGLVPEDVVDIVARLRGEGPVAYVHASHSAYHGSYSLSTQMADMSFAHAPFRRHARLFREALPGLPIIAVCRLDSIAEAAELVDGGEAELVALARPHIADPEIVRKTRDGRTDEIRSCLACNQGCIGRLEQSLPISCVVNPEVGAEREWQRAWVGLTGNVRRRQVLVVGGGPAGLSAAASAARAGDTVTLVERAHHLGGALAVAARIPGRERLALLVDDLVAEVNRRGVATRLGTELIATDITAGGWDEVVVATGSRPVARDLGAGVDIVDTAAAVEVAAHGDVAGRTVVVVDEDGDWPAWSITDALAARGARVHLVAAGPGLAPRITTYSRLALQARLRERRVQIHLLHMPAVTAPGEVTLTHTYSGQTRPLTDVDLLIDVARPVARDDLYRALDADPGGLRVHVVGDANSPRTALEAVYEGRMAGAFLGDLKDPTARGVAATY